MNHVIKYFKTLTIKTHQSGDISLSKIFVVKQAQAIYIHENEKCEIFMYIRKYGEKKI